MAGTNFRKHFPGTGNYFPWFSCQKKQNLWIVVTYLSTNASFRVVETDLLAITNHFLYIYFQRHLPVKSFFHLAETYFWTNLSVRLLEKDFFSSENRLLYLRLYFYYRKPSSFKDRTYSCRWKLLDSGNHFLSLTQIFLKEFFIPGSGKLFFSLKEKALFLVPSLFSCK